LVQTGHCASRARVIIPLAFPTFLLAKVQARNAGRHQPGKHEGKELPISWSTKSQHGDWFWASAAAICRLRCTLFVRSALVARPNALSHMSLSPSASSVRIFRFCVTLGCEPASVPPITPFRVGYFKCTIRVSS
jgi:hypothetical protein